DEIGDLSDKFELMQDSIIGYIGSLADKTAKEEKMKAELSLAARIQAESLPRGGIKEGGVTLSSFLKPAREVGGDLYDYFKLDDENIFFGLADVSGKGVPASLFMMRAKELIRSHVMQDKTLSELAYKLNNELCAGNEESIFITAFFGVLNTKTGRLSYLRAGHEQPMLRRGGEVNMISEESNFVLGVFEDMSYSFEETVLKPGDTLLMYTDGLSEGINEKEEAFGYGRIASALEDAGEDVTGEMYSALLDFCGGAEQFDDVTMLAVSVDKSKKLEIADPKYDDITSVTDAVLAELGAYPKERASEVGLIIDEIMNNQISYAFADTQSPRIGVELELEGDEAKLVFEDNGMAFDPLSEVSDEAIESSEGGYGLALVKALSDEQSYERVNGLNRLTVIKRMVGGEEE
ncbi:MAG: SpoIIE family protein phosphatase, partial [Clostridia bacterium]|nr:SpoIIE family protein phosphatase [Clostridia bacterium]